MMIDVNKPYSIQTLQNGLSVILVPMPAVKSITVMVMVGAGSRYEAKEINGLSHFLEHMAFKGTKKRPSSQIIAGTIDGIGGEFNAFTSKDHTGFYIKAASAHTGLLIDVLSDMLLNSLLTPSEIEREKGVIIEEINMYADTPIRHISDIYEDLLYGDHPLGWNIAGTADIIRTIKRQDFVDYMGELYLPNNRTIVVAGGIDGQSKGKGKGEEIVLKSIIEKLGGWKKNAASGWNSIKIAQSKPKVKLEYKDTEQAHIALGVHAYSYVDPRRYALSVLAAILGGGMSSRLFIQVRERRGLAYYVRSDSEFYMDVGGFVTQAGVDVKRIDDAIKVILSEYYGIASGKFEISDEELTKSKEYLKGRLTLELEDSRSVAGLYATQEILKRKINTPQEVMIRTESVTKKQVLDVAKEIFVKKHLNLAIIGPYKDQSRFEKLLE